MPFFPQPYFLSFLLFLSFPFYYKNQELCRKIHKQIDLLDEERYDMENKVNKSDKEVGSFLTNVIFYLKLLHFKNQYQLHHILSTRADHLNHMSGGHNCSLIPKF